MAARIAEVFAAKNDSGGAPGGSGGSWAIHSKWRICIVAIAPAQGEAADF